MFSYFESSVDGIIPNEYSSLESICQEMFSCLVCVKDCCMLTARRFWLAQTQLTPQLPTRQFRLRSKDQSHKIATTSSITTSATTNEVSATIEGLISKPTSSSTASTPTSTTSTNPSSTATTDNVNNLNNFNKLNNITTNINNRKLQGNGKLLVLTNNEIREEISKNCVDNFNVIGTTNNAPTKQCNSKKDN